MLQQRVTVWIDLGQGDQVPQFEMWVESLQFGSFCRDNILGWAKFFETAVDLETLGQLQHLTTAPLIAIVAMQAPL